MMRDAFTTMTMMSRAASARQAAAAFSCARAASHTARTLSLDEQVQ